MKELSMFRLWGKLFKNNEMINDLVYEDTSDSDFLGKTKKGLEYLCYEFDISKPMWFSENKADYQVINKTSFYDHHFIESINFDYFEIEIIENDI